MYEAYGGVFDVCDIRALEVLDSRGRPTLRVCVSTGVAEGCADAPAGASRGAHEAIELRDGGSRLMGYGVRRAVFVVESVIGPEIIGMDVRDQVGIDKKIIELDGTENKSKLGGNATVATSLAVARTASLALGLELFNYLGGPSARIMPVPMMNVVNGGAHAGNKLDFQEFMIVPVGKDSFTEALWMAAEVYMSLKNVVKEKYGLQGVNVGDEGGFAPPISDPREALQLLEEAVKRAGYSAGSDIVFAIDVAASQFYDKERKTYKFMDREWSAGELLDYYVELTSEFPVKSIEDPFFEENFEEFAELAGKLGRRGVIVVGDDLYTTNPKRLEQGLQRKATTGVIVKVNQIGTLTEALDFIRNAREGGQRIIVSHRSGETEDTFIADLAVAVSAHFIKTGAPCRGERTAKYNRLLEIDALLGETAVYPGDRVFKAINP